MKKILFILFMFVSIVVNGQLNGLVQVSSGGGGTDSADVIAITGRVLDTTNFAANASADANADTGLSYYNGGFGVYLVHQPALKYFTADITRYYVNAFNYGSTNTTVTPNGTLYAWPIYFTNTMTFDTVVIEVVANTSGGREFVFGIYSDNGSCFPDAKIWQTGVQSAAAVDTIFNTISPALTVTANTLYWICMNGNNANPTVRSINASTQMPNFLGYGLGTLGGSDCIGKGVTYNATLPTTFPTGITYYSKSQPLFLWKR